MEKLQVGQRVKDATINGRGKGSVISVDEDGSQVFLPLTYTVKWDDGEKETLINPREITAV